MVHGTKSWDKTKRHLLNPKTKMHFEQLATGYIFSKRNKFNVFSHSVNADGKLHHVHNLTLQLRQLRQHCFKYDLDDIFYIVVPYNVHEHSRIDSQTFDLIDDFAKLHVNMVANSDAWFHYWVGESYVQENMQLGYELLQNNTDEDLWNKTVEEYLQFHPIY